MKWRYLAQMRRQIKECLYNKKPEGAGANKRTLNYRIIQHPSNRRVTREMEADKEKSEVKSNASIIINPVSKVRTEETPNSNTMPVYQGRQPEHH